jgi:hypothetical protein
MAVIFFPLLPRGGSGVIILTRSQALLGNANGGEAPASLKQAVEKKSFVTIPCPIKKQMSLKSPFEKGGFRGIFRRL